MKKCRFCLEIIYDNEFDVIGAIARQMLNGLLLALNLDEGNEAVMCHDCAGKLQNALDFKTSCLEAEYKILPNINSGESIKKESVVKFSDSFEGQKICRFCKKLTKSGGFTHLQENIFMVDMILKHIPELHLSVTEELLTCEACLASLQCLVSFITACLIAEDKIKSNVDGDGFTKINCDNGNIIKVEEKNIRDAGDVAVKAEIKYENGMEIDNVEITIKVEESETLSEQRECERLQNTSHEYLQVILGKTEEHEKYSLRNKLNKPSPIEKSSSAIMYNCQKCPFKTKYEFNFRKHGFIHINPSDRVMLKCNECSYNARFVSDLKRHILVHQNPLEIHMYTCEICQFETKRKGTLTKHMRVHQDPTELSVYKCETCSLMLKHKHSLKRHQLTHQTSSELAVHKCKSCNYETNHRSQLNTHMLTHKSPSEVTMFSCEICTFQTKRKHSLKKHLVTHQDRSEVTLFKCDRCTFETRRKWSLTKHMVTHQDQSEATLYKCAKCSFETKHKHNLIGHCMTHHQN